MRNEISKKGPSMSNRLQPSKGKANILTQQRVVTKTHKLIAITVVVVLCAISLVMWRAMDKPTVQRGQDMAQTRQGGNSPFPNAEARQESRDQASFFITFAPREEKEKYPEKVTEAVQVGKDNTASREQLEGGMTTLRDEARKYRENGRVQEAMDLETRAMELEAKRMTLEAREMDSRMRAMDQERLPQKP